MTTATKQRRKPTRKTIRADVMAKLTPGQIEARNQSNVAETKVGHELVWLMTGYYEGGTIMFKGVSGLGGKVPALYPRDRYPFANVVKAPLVKDFGRAIRHFYYRKPKPKAGPIQLPVSMMRDFSFTKKEIRLATTLALI